MKQCSKCKKIKPLSEFYKCKNHKDGYRSSCIECDKERYQKYYINNKELIREQWRNKAKLKRQSDSFDNFKETVYLCCRRADKLNIPYENKDILYDYIKSISTGYCEICGQPIKHNKNKKQSNSISIDRLIPDRGYIKNNISLICFRCNTIKNNGTIEEHIIISDWLKQMENPLSRTNIKYLNTQTFNKKYNKEYWEIYHELALSLIQRAKTLNVPYDKIKSLEQYLEYYLDYHNDYKLTGYCDICNNIVTQNIKNIKSNSITVSRIIPSEGYIINNLAVLCYKCNSIKNEGTWKEHLMIANWMKSKINNLI